MPSCRYVYTTPYIHLLHWEKTFNTYYIPVIFYTRLRYVYISRPSKVLMDRTAQDFSFQIQTSNQVNLSDSNDQKNKTGKLSNIISVKACFKDFVQDQRKGKFNLLIFKAGNFIKFRSKSSLSFQHGDYHGCRKSMGCGVLFTQL